MLPQARASLVAFSLHSLVSPRAVWLQHQYEGLMTATSLHHTLFLALAKATHPHHHPIAAHRLNPVPTNLDCFSHCLQLGYYSPNWETSLSPFILVLLHYGAI